ncbi:MAG: hypothetical protein ACEQSX_15220, partial [Baekduiaceae bacterium]
MSSLTRRLRAQDGATSVEFVAVVPIVIALVFGAWQALVAGQVVWLSGGAAAAAARAHAVGGDPRAAARASLPAPHAQPAVQRVGQRRPGRRPWIAAA